MGILSGPLKGTVGIRQLVDRISLSEDPDANSHADLKPENIVFSSLSRTVTSELLVKIIDFGLGNKMKTDIV
ncbi:hypothetical protein M7I_5954 [Glarea lozoyensis 74030]|uniref:Protein kinase domain-containing protein n=1 Tax=Glarea lozoyensis (strain ATCC 74030 / MF5533) TaxID=1104152 RepID=H0ET95_GLAL7|nr:hypothetical protein M7I_5954 [Glarea lozoyensis 74030]